VVVELCTSKNEKVGGGVDNAVGYDKIIIVDKK
jgi:hypothetical protein